MRCLNCGEEVPQTAGKRVKQYCNDACKKAYYRKKRARYNGTESISGHIGTAYRDKLIEDKEDTPLGVCRYCGDEIHELTRCCGPCALKMKRLCAECRFTCKIFDADDKTNCKDFVKKIHCIEKDAWLKDTEDYPVRMREPVF